MASFSLGFRSSRIEAAWNDHRSGAMSRRKQQASFLASIIILGVTTLLCFTEETLHADVVDRFLFVGMLLGVIFVLIALTERRVRASASTQDAISTAQIFITLMLLAVSASAFETPGLALGLWFTHSCLFQSMFRLRFVASLAAYTLPGIVMAVILRESLSLPAVLLVLLPQLFVTYQGPRTGEVQDRRMFLFTRMANEEIDAKSSEMNVLNEKLLATEEEKAVAQSIVDEVMSEDYKFDLEMTHFLIRWRDLHFEQVLGQGAFGLVHRGLWHGQTVAIKTIRVTKVTKRVLKRFRAEIKVMAPLRHNNLITMYGACWKDGPDKLCLVLEFAGRGDFKELLDDKSMSWAHPRRQVMEGACACMVYMHNLDPPVIHRDLKPDNILIDASYEGKVCDFGVSRRFQITSTGDECGDATDAENMSIVGTPLFCGPEMFRGEAYNEKVDIYAIGLILLQAVVGDSQYIRNSYAKGTVAASVMLGARPKIPRWVGKGCPALAELIERCWLDNFRSRPSSLEVFTKLQELPVNCFEDTSSNQNDAVRTALGEKRDQFESRDIGAGVNSKLSGSGKSKEDTPSAHKAPYRERSESRNSSEHSLAQAKARGRRTSMIMTMGFLKRTGTEESSAAVSTNAMSFKGAGRPSAEAFKLSVENQQLSEEIVSLQAQLAELKTSMKAENSGTNTRLKLSPDDRMKVNLIAKVGHAS